MHGLQYLVNEVREGRRKPDFEVLRAMVHYIDAFPEKLHHPKEDRYLFARLRQRSTEANSVLDQLEAEHIHGAKLIRDLEQDLLRWEMGGDENFAAFAEKVKQYADFHWHHMRQEEQVVLPLAERVLTEEDWREIDAAFAGNADPLIGKKSEGISSACSSASSTSPHRRLGSEARTNLLPAATEIGKQSLESKKDRRELRPGQITFE